MKHDPHAHADGSRECRPAHDMGPVPGEWPDGWPEEELAQAVLLRINREYGLDGRTTRVDVNSGPVRALMRLHAEHVPYVAPVDPILEAARELLIEDHKNNDYSFWWEGHLLEYGTGDWLIRAGKEDGVALSRHAPGLRTGVKIGKAQQPVRDLPDREAIISVLRKAITHGVSYGGLCGAADAVLALIVNPEAQR